MTKPIFVDTSYFLALVNSHDEFHQHASILGDINLVGANFAFTAFGTLGHGAGKLTKRQDRNPMVFILDLNIRNSIMAASKGLHTECGW